MNIAVYVTSKYNNYEELTKLLDDHIRKATTTPVLLLTDTGDGNKLVKQYADEHNIKTKIYSTEWGRFGNTAGIIAVYHMLHNSEKGICLWNGLSRGCEAFLKMSQRLNRNVDLIRVSITNTPTVNVEQPQDQQQQQAPEGQPSDIGTNGAPSAGSAPSAGGGVPSTAGGTPSVASQEGGEQTGEPQLDAEGNPIEQPPAEGGEAPEGASSEAPSAGEAPAATTDDLLAAGGQSAAAPEAPAATAAPAGGQVAINPNAANVQLPVTQPPQPEPTEKNEQ